MSDSFDLVDKIEFIMETALARKWSIQQTTVNNSNNKCSGSSEQFSLQG